MTNPNTELETLAEQTARLIGRPTTYAIILDALQRVQENAASTLSKKRIGKPLSPAELARNRNAAKLAGRPKGSKNKPKALQEEKQEKRNERNHEN